MTRKYFGTDGVRGKVGEYPITPDFVMKLGWAAGKVLSKKGTKKVLIGKDTRISGYMLESALEAGLSAAGLKAILMGPMPTPAVAYLTRTFRAEAGIVISASHNPYYDNGIKVFSADGTKLPDDVELAIEAGVPIGWRALARTQDRVIGLDRFGASGPGPDVAAALGLTIDAFDAVELNEAFASQALAVLRGLGLPDDAGRALLDELVEHATQRRFVYTHRWRVDDLVMWDNRCTMHRGTEFDDLRWRRDVQRSTVSDVANTCEQAGITVPA